MSLFFQYSEQFKSRRMSEASFSPFHVEVPGGAPSSQVMDASSRSITGRRTEGDRGSVASVVSFFQNYTVDKYICFCIPKHWVMLDDEGHVEACDNSPMATIFLLLNTMIGKFVALVNPTLTLRLRYAQVQVSWYKHMSSQKLVLF